jgi:hypothetical protein
MRTVFVIGAGANAEIGMPTGEKLKKDIIKALDFSSIFTDSPSIGTKVYFSMQDIFDTKERIDNIASTIREAMPFAISIDNFLDAHRLEDGIADAGKIAIIAAILAAERKSYLSKLPNSQEVLSETWYPLFFKKISEGCEINEFIERLKDISFIIFNYDRCFEHYMIHAIDVYYKISRSRAINLVEQMNIIHPYGYIGNLNRVPLGEALDYKKLGVFYRNIRTFAEDSEETKKERTEIKHLIDRANRVIFLGFAYHRMNLDLLFKYPGYAATLADDAPLTDHFDCYGTGFGISDGDRKYIQDILRKLDPRINNCDISGDKCADFFNNFWYRLSFQD